MEHQLSGQEVVIVAVAVWFVGTFINNRVPLLKRYSIPVAVTGGVLFSIIVTVIRSAFDLTISLNLELRDLANLRLRPQATPLGGASWRDPGSG